ncbi:threonine/serine exporter family protein [Leucobacter rhizosphaerae]|uniref:Threonine/serine exporter family protein n=1 Tax=Leucobacter rhizosphaerae TaxID=2932245 RepID=A0ABY4FTE1_9MICO|nr:threonine/serine exporter family protein [Leucobacter rhizosphaerae]UOQ59429.1 threonine/serine exporter family protein [Leucobacter rhizosphaerae]
MSELIGRFRRAVRALGSDQDTPTAPPTADGVVGMLGAIGPALLAASQATSDIQLTLQGVAARYGRPDLRVFVLPTLVIVEDQSSTPAQTAIFPADTDALRLDQAGAVSHLVRRTSPDRTAPDAVIAEIARIRASPPRFGAVLTVLGHTLLSLGFGLMINPTLTALPVYAILGAIVGVILLLAARAPTLSLILPVFTAFAATVVIAWLVRPLVHDDVVRLVAPSLVSFLPGLTLAIAAVELTSGQIMAGASRLVYGIARLGLLAFGVYAGISVAGSPAVTTAPEQLGSWAPWVGIALVSLGYYFFSSAPRRSLPWILYALVVAYAAQLLGNLLLGAELSGLIGAAVAVPAAYLAARFRAAPPASIMLTCAYWLLVPGAMGFIGVSEAAAGTSGASDTILRTFGSLIAIAIGMVLGAGFSRDVTAVSRGWRGSSAPTDPAASASSSGGTTGTATR